MLAFVGRDYQFIVWKFQICTVLHRVITRPASLLGINKKKKGCCSLDKGRGLVRGFASTSFLVHRPKQVAGVQHELTIFATPAVEMDYWGLLSRNSKTIGLTKRYLRVWVTGDRGDFECS